MGHDRSPLQCLTLHRSPLVFRMKKQTTYFLLRIDHPETVNVDGLKARFKGGQNVIDLQVLEHSETVPAGDHVPPYLAW
jgi:hypothetical protein